MAENAANRISWLLELHRNDTEWLAAIRHWQHLKAATDESSCWITGFNEREINDPAVKSIPAKTIWRQEDNLLFLQHNLVPSRKAPSLLWTPIERALPIELPQQNHNFFGINDRLSSRLVRSSEEHPVAAMMTTLPVLQSFIEAAPAIRLRDLGWTIINGNKALIIGTPALPIQGQTFWQSGLSLLPTGYQFEWPMIAALLEAQQNGDQTAIIIWNEDNSWIRIPRESVRPLTIGSFRQTALLSRSTINQGS